MKRFTETTKWRDPWYRKLTGNAKLLWCWLTDNCDNAGVIDLDLESASFDIGETIQAEHVAELESRLKRMPNGKYWIVKFIPFQYGKLSASCSPHIRVLELLKAHGLTYTDCLDNATLPSGTQSLDTLPLGSLPRKGIGTLQERKGKEPEEERKGGVGGDSLAVFESLKSRLYRLFDCDPNRPLGNLNEQTLAEIARRKTCFEEFALIECLKNSLPPEDKQFFPQSLTRLLEGWDDTLDRAKGASKNGGKKHDPDWVPLDAKPKKRSTERVPYPGFPAGFTVDSPPKREYFRDDRAFETCHIFYSDWLEWRKIELAKQAGKAAEVKA